MDLRAELRRENEIEVAKERASRRRELSDDTRAAYAKENAQELAKGRAERRRELSTPNAG